MRLCETFTFPISFMHPTHYLIWLHKECDIHGHRAVKTCNSFYNDIRWGTKIKHVRKLKITDACWSANNQTYVDHQTTSTQIVFYLNVNVGMHKGFCLLTARNDVIHTGYHYQVNVPLWLSLILLLTMRASVATPRRLYALDALSQYEMIRLCWTLLTPWGKIPLL